MNLFLLLFPDLALIAIGFVLSRKVDWGSDLWPGIEKLTYYVLFPALLFHAIVRNPVQWDMARDLVLGVLLVVTAAAMTGALGHYLLKPPALRSASSAQCAYRFNSYVAMALSQRLGGTEGLALCAVCLGVAVPVVNVLAVSSLARHARTGLLSEWVRNPLILATLAGLLAAWAGLGVPESADALLTRIGAAALGLGLMSVGAGIRLTGVGGDRGLIAWLTAVKLLIAPAAALAAGRWLELEPMAQTVLVVFGAVPTASAAYILANRMGGDGPFVALCITVSTFAAVLTLPFWLSVIV
jgi:malonate transporter and related proteins